MLCRHYCLYTHSYPFALFLHIHWWNQGCDTVVSISRNFVRGRNVQLWRRYLGTWVYLCWVCFNSTFVPWLLRDWPAVPHLSGSGHSKQLCVARGWKLVSLSCAFAGTPLCCPYLLLTVCMCACVFRRDYQCEFPRFPPQDLSRLVPQLNESGLDLLQKLLCFDPNSRLPVHAALNHTFFEQNASRERATHSTEVQFRATPAAFDNSKY